MSTVIITENKDNNLLGLGIDFKEHEYTIEEEAEANKQFMLGLAFGEINNNITLDKLKEWWVKLTIIGNELLENITNGDLKELACNNGINLIEGVA